jgi:TRAP transporter TAXI family solute receptor
MKRNRYFKIVILCFILSIVLATVPSLVVSAGPSETIELEIYSNPLGATGYVLSFGLAEIINKHSTRYHATCVESKGLTVNMYHLIKNPEARKNTILYVNNVGVGEARNGFPPFKEPYLDFRYIALAANMNIFMVSANPNITKIEDLVGKRVAVGAKGHSTEYTMRLVLDHGYGIWDKLKTSYLSMGAVKDALVDGTIDAGVAAAAVFEPGGNWKGNPACDQLLNTKRCNLLSYSEEAIAKARQKSGYELYPMAMGPKEYGKTTVTEPCTGVVVACAWVVDKTMPDEYVQDIVKIMYEHADEFAQYHATGKAIKKTTISTVSAPKDQFHPAAIKFYEEHGLKLGK